MANMDVPISKIDFEYLIDAAEKIYNQKVYFISDMLFKEAQNLLENHGPTEYTEELQSRIREGLLRIEVLGTIKIPPYPLMGKKTIGKLENYYRDYEKMYQIDKLRILNGNFQVLPGKYETSEYILTTSKALRTALKMLSRVTPKDRTDIPKKFLQDTEYGDSDEDN